MRKFSIIMMALMMVLSASAIDLASLKKLPAPKNLKIERFNRPNSPVRKAAAAWENTPAPFASMYNSTGLKYDFDAPEEEDPWYETDPWQTWAEEYDYDGETWYGLVNIIPNEGQWPEDPVIDYYYNAEEGAVVVPCTPLARYDEETLIYIMDIYDFGQGESGDIYFTLDKDGNFAREADCYGHAVAWAVCYYDEETYEPIDILGYFGVYAAMDYEKTGVVESAITYTANEKLEETKEVWMPGLNINAFDAIVVSHTFSDGTGTITFSGEVTSIGETAFSECFGLTSIAIPNSVTSIGEFAFYGCTGLTSIAIPNSVMSIGEWAFADCSSLTTVALPSSVTSIEAGTFSNCTNLTSIAIPNSVMSIGDWAFSECSNLTSVVIPNSVMSIGVGAFSGCSGLTSITCEAVIPPYCANNCFKGVDYTIPVYVPEESVATYKTENEWEKFTHIQAQVFTLTLDADPSMGAAYGEGVYSKGSEVQIFAIVNSGYEFTGWSDGNTDNPRLLTLTCDSTITANFEEISVPQYTIDVTAENPALGTATATVLVLVEAVPNPGCTFVSWSDGNNENPRYIPLTDDIYLQAIFSGVPTGVAESAEKAQGSVRKVIVDGQLHIIRDDKTYTMQGVVVE